MAEFKLSAQELEKLSDGIVFARARINIDRLENVFTEMSLIDYEIIEKLWPAIVTDTEAPTEKKYLQEIKEQTEIPMNQISGIVQKLNNRGLVKWERGESGTYIELSESGRMRFKKQQIIILNYIERIVNRIGVERMKEIIEEMNYIETIMSEEAQNLDI